MSKNIWNLSQDVNDNPNRNHFDLSFQNHLTMKMGTLYPVMCKECVPGDTFKIDAAFGLKFMPLVFPVQSHMRAHLHFFYVRNKNLWEDWENFISGLDTSVVHPYINQGPEFFKTGTLSDYLDVPSTVVSGQKIRNVFISRATGYATEDARHGHTEVVDGAVRVTYDDVTVANNGIFSYYTYWWLNNVEERPQPGDSWREHVDTNAGGSSALDALTILLETQRWPLYFYDCRLEHNLHVPNIFSFETNEINADDASYSCELVFWEEPHTTFNDVLFSPFPNGGGYRAFGNRVVTSMVVGNLVSNEIFTSTSEPSNWLTFKPTSDQSYENALVAVNQSISSGKDVYVSLRIERTTDPQTLEINSPIPAPHSVPIKPINVAFTGRFQYNYTSDTVEDADHYPYDQLHLNKKGIYLNALPYRAYESIYNAYYRDWRTQPFVVNGQEVFNKYNTTVEQGRDDTYYTLYRRNYELDYLTSSLPSPQFGVAPLVGMTALGNITIEDANGITTANAEVDTDGTITKVTLTSPAASVEHARTAMNIAASGMSINDFRNVNALQRFLETTLRKGYKYRDFIAGHFGKEPEYRELDMPEFIGGTSEDVVVNLVTNMTASENSSPLGSYAGTANAFGSSRHTVTHYCDDYGFIVGILCVVPTPAYSQLLPKHFLHNSQLDYYFPEFSQIGMQPITYEEVCPITAYMESEASSYKTLLTDTFAYQRPNYDLVGFTDQVHGEFRTTLRNFLINRHFAERPELGSEFLEINPGEVNDIFAYTDTDADTILGQVVFSIDAIRPVPRVVIPNLGK